jgi:hypothetical protein
MLNGRPNKARAIAVSKNNNRDVWNEFRQDPQRTSAPLFIGVHQREDHQLRPGTAELTFEFRRCRVGDYWRRKRRLHATADDFPHERAAFDHHNETGNLFADARIGAMRVIVVAKPTGS